MSIFGKYSIRSLSKNKTRTFMTIVGIVLSVSMFTAVTEAVASFRSYLIAGIENEVGSWHAKTSLISGDQFTKLEKDEEVEKTEFLGAVGYAGVDSANHYKPYIYVANMSKGFTDLVSVDVTYGRLPQNNGEICLPSHLYSNGNVSMKLGDTLSLEIGERVLDGETLSQDDSFKEDETLNVTAKRSYTVVGFYERFSTRIEAYPAPGYTALTIGEPTEGCEAFFTLKNAAGAYDFAVESGQEYGDIGVNRDLLMLYGISRHATVMRMFISLAAVLIALIMFGSVALIYNSFSISVSERTKQFGILKSIGATKKQIRRTVFSEALFLCLVGVPLGLLAGCAGLGVTFYLLRGSLGSFGSLFGVEGSAVLRLVISPAALVIAAAIGVVTTVISAYIPARRAIKVPAIEAVRRTSDINVKNVKIRSHRLTYKLFGFEGMIAAKNFRRNKKRYRAAILSLFMSVVLFISASSFCSYLTVSVGAMDTTDGYDISYRMNSDSREDTERVYNMLRQADGVTDSVFYQVVSKHGFIKREYIPAATNKLLGNDETAQNSDYSSIVYNVYYVNDEYYQKLAAQNKIAVDMTDPGALIKDTSDVYLESDDGYVFHTVHMLDRNTVGDGFDLIEPKSYDGFTLYGLIGDRLYYIPDDFGNDELIEVTEDMMTKLPVSEASAVRHEKIAGFLDSELFFNGGDFALIYPMSMYKETSLSSVTMMFTSKNHKLTCEKMTQMLTDIEADRSGLYDYAESIESSRAMVRVVNVFAYGFIILISMIALTNVFNTISTNIFLRRRELAMMKSVGMTKSGFSKMMNYECIICGLRGLLLGLPVSVIVTFMIYLSVRNGYAATFYMPWYSIAISVFSVFAVVFIAMLYTMRRIRRENTIDILRNENI